MKRLKIGVLLIVLMTSAWTSQAQTELKEQLTISLTEPGKPYKLDVSLFIGSITVVGYEGKDILLNVRTEENTGKKTKENEGPAGMKRYSLDNKTDITAEVKNNVVVVRSKIMNQAYHLTLKIPQKDVNLILKSVEKSDIKVSNVAGEMEVTSVNGSIQLNKIAGSVVANTVNGAIVVVFKGIDAKAPMAFSTLNGNIDVTFPDALKANLKLKSDHGEIYSDYNIAVDPGKTTTEQNKKTGLFRIHLNDWLIGKVNGGGPEMLMKNMDGNIYIRKAK